MSASRKELLNGHVLGAQSGGAPLVGAEGGGEQAHPEGLGQNGHAAADGAQADHAQGPASS